jgi:Cu/Ag efflux protein CusF
MKVRPEDLTSQEVRDLPEGRIHQIVSRGIKSAGMPGFKGRISDEALWRIALYVNRLSRGQAGPTPTPAALAQVSPSPSARSKFSTPDTEQRYPFKGKVVAVARETQQVTVEHEAIPGYMGAMTMPFPLKNEKILGSLKKDDRIQATLIIDSNGWRLENVEIK